MNRRSHRAFAARPLIALAFAVGMLLLSAPSRAMEAEVAWNPSWPRFRKAEIALTAGLSFQVAANLFLYPRPQRNWVGGILFDDAARDLLVLGTPEARSKAADVSDQIYYGLATFPILLDTAIVAGAVHRSGDVALQMFAMNFEGYALAGAIAMSAEKIGRVRPVDRGCQKDPKYSGRCGSDAQLNVSFMSGHTAIAFTGAGLTCAHHTHLPLYGGGAADTMACLLSLAAATAAGTLRISSDGHYATDVVLGTGLGLFAGWGMPELLHYHGGDRRGARRTSLLPTFRTRHGEVTAVVAPSFDGGRAGLTLAGAF